MVASNSQPTPSRTEVTLAEGEHNGPQQNALLPHLFPKQVSQIEPASIATSKAKQANEHDEKQCEVGSERSYDG